MATRLVKSGGWIVGITLIALLFIQYKTEYAIKNQLLKVVAQQLDYDEMQASFIGNKIVFKDATLKNIEASAGEFNFKAKILTLEVDYTNALLRNIQIKGIKAQNVSLAFDYTEVGKSNIHEIQQNLRNYIKKRKTENKPSVVWDVYTIELRDVNVKLNDFQYGDIGTFAIDSITIPHVSSKYSGRNNRDILFLAVAKELSKQFMEDKIRGNYDKNKFTRFIARESTSEIKDFLQLSKTIMSNKLRSLWKKMNSQKAVTANEDKT